MCNWTVRNTFVYAVEDVEDSDSEESPCCRARSSSDGLTMRTSWALSGWEAPQAEDAGCSTPTSVPRCLEDLAAALEAGGDLAVSAMAYVRAEMASMSFDASGCRVAQRALELADPAEAFAIADVFRGSVLEAARSPYAQHVLQSVIHRVGTEDAAFIAEDPRTVALADRILDQDLASLVCHKFGHRVAAAMVSVGLRKQRAALAEALLGDLQRFARHRFASRVLEAALLHGTPAQQAKLAFAVMEQPGAVVSLACHAFGAHVVRAVLQVPGESDRALQFLIKSERKLRKDRYGLELLQELSSLAVVASGTLGGA